jgi:HAD superfamily hydrolase (TIGR01509 family)
MRLPKEGIKNIIFDLGGVLINIEPGRSHAALKRFAGPRNIELQRDAAAANIFQEYERGVLDSNQFRNFFRSYVEGEVNDERIDLAWNAMLMDIPNSRIDLLLELRKQYRIFLLSNTNEIHMTRINHYINAVYGLSSFDRIFEQVYLSYEMGTRKPEAAIYERVFSENNLLLEETLFIDDSEENVAGARKAGLLSHHLEADQTVEMLFAK